MKLPTPKLQFGLLIFVGLFVLSFFAFKMFVSPDGTRGQFTQSTVGLIDAQDSKTVTLKNGDVYILTAGLVKKNINGKEIKMLAYNGSIPGPIIKIPQGATVTINFKNNLDVATTLHSHGIRTDNKFDGVPDVTQKEIPIGGAYTYKLSFPDAGVFWYHAHVREDYTQQLGLYGNYLVIPKDTTYYSQVNKEIPLTISDLLLDNGEAGSFNKESVTHTLMGRFGSIMLTNGEVSYKNVVNKGDVVRFYFTNTANTRPFNITIPGVKMKLVGGDNGKYEQEQFVDSVLLSPSERSIVEVLFDKSGSFTIVNKTPQKSYQLGMITVSDIQTSQSYTSQFVDLRTNSDVIASIDPLRQYFDKQPDKNLTLSLSMMNSQNGSNNMGGHTMNMMGGGSQMNMGDTQSMGTAATDKIEWEDTMGSMNMKSDTNMMKWKLIDSDTKKENMDINWQFKKGQVVKLTIFNDPNSAHPMQHPIHIHGQRFLVLATNGIKNTNLIYKDSALIQKGDKVEFIAIFLSIWNLG
jgi:suppressor of ftsI